MLSCPACNHELPNRENLVYCPSCGVQSKCKSCGTVLEAEYMFCIFCGTASSSSAQAISVHEHLNDRQVLNEVEFREESNGRSHSRFLKARFTDVVGAAALGSHVLEVLADTPSRGESRKTRSSGYEVKPVVDNGQLSLPISAQIEDEMVLDTGVQSIPISQVNKGDDDRLKDIFRYEGGNIRLVENRLKAKNKQDMARRVIILLLYAHELQGNSKVMRSIITEELQKAKIYDGNTRTLISKEVDWMQEEGNLVLRNSGREIAKQYLDDIADSSIPDGWNPSKSGTGKSSKSGSEDLTDGNARRRRSATHAECPVAKELTVKWKSSNQLLADVSILKEYSVVKKGVLGLWAITQISEELDVQVSGYTLASFLYLNFGLHVEKKDLEKRLKEIDGQGNLIKLENGFQLRMPAKKWIKISCEYSS
jgi:hypothetical protein